MELPCVIIIIILWYIFCQETNLECECNNNCCYFMSSFHVTNFNVRFYYVYMPPIIPHNYVDIKLGLEIIT